MTSTFKIVNGDMDFSSATGRPFMVEDDLKLNQDVRENLDTKAQEDGTGADLDGVITMIGDVFSLRAEIARRVNDSFAALKQVQETIQRFDRTPRERISRVAQVLVLPVRAAGSGEFSHTTFAYRVDVLSGAASRATVGGQLVR